MRRTREEIIHAVEHRWGIRPFILGNEGCLCGECFDRRLEEAFEPESGLRIATDAATDAFTDVIADTRIAV